jgi:hypothetical protein
MLRVTRLRLMAGTYDVLRIRAVRDHIALVLHLDRVVLSLPTW